MPIIIIANKSDEYEIERTIVRDAVESTLMSWGCVDSHIECSAKENINIDQIFQRLYVKLSVPIVQKAAIHQCQRSNHHQLNDSRNSVSVRHSIHEIH